MSEQGRMHEQGHPSPVLVICAALSAALAIAAGAFGAHGAASAEAADWLRTGAQYQMIHAVAAIVLARRAPMVTAILLVGAAIFAITLYAMAMGAPRWFGAITPIGGTLLILGWLMLAVAVWRRR